MRIISLAMGVVGCTSLVPAQAPYWATRAGGGGIERIADVKVGTSDMVFSVGHYSPGASVAGQGLVSQGSTDVFVMKQDAAGLVQWIVTGGGPGIDLGMKVQPAPGGDLVVCGQFTGVADLFGITVSANGGSTDMFVARLDGASGSALWVRTGGSATFSDRATGVTIAQDGRVIVSGEFRGNGLFDAGSFNSVIDPGTNLPGADIFLASFAPDGTAQWLKQGLAKYDDAASDVAADAVGNTYLLGLFSDTVQFDVPHPNTAMNQGVLAKFDPLGNEVWFRRIGGAAFQRMADLQVTDAGALLVCGDVQGNITFFDDAPNIIPSASPYAYFLLSATPAGDLGSGVSEGSDALVSATALHQQGTSVHVLGSFECQFTALAALYGATGLFIANGQPDLFIGEHAMSGLALLSAQQFGGHQSKVPGGITALTNGAVLFSGSFEELLIFPGDGEGWGETLPCPPSTCLPDTICGDVHYNDYEAIESGGLADGFVARGLVVGRQPYDNWCRTGGCDRSALPILILNEEGLDTVVACDADTLRWFGELPRPHIGCPSGRTTSWDLNVAWNTGASTDTIHV